MAKTNAGKNNGTVNKGQATPEVKKPEEVIAMTNANIKVMLGVGDKAKEYEVAMRTLEGDGQKVLIPDNRTTDEAAKNTIYNVYGQYYWGNNPVKIQVLKDRGKTTSADGKLYNMVSVGNIPDSKRIKNDIVKLEQVDKRLAGLVLVCECSEEYNKKTAKCAHLLLMTETETQYLLLYVSLASVLDVLSMHVGEKKAWAVYDAAIKQARSLTTAGTRKSASQVTTVASVDLFKVGAPAEEPKAEEQAPAEAEKEAEQEAVTA